MVSQALTAAVGQSTFQAVIQNRQEPAHRLRDTLQNLHLDDAWGIEIVDAGLGEINVPPGVAEAIARQVAVGLMAPARTAEGVGTAEALNQMQAALNDPSTVDRALLLQITRLLSDAIAQRK
jgi:regulator of protease activity HflC (stomatin/prohibitin superfamily)